MIFSGGLHMCRVVRNAFQKNTVKMTYPKLAEIVGMGSIKGVLRNDDIGIFGQQVLPVKHFEYAAAFLYTYQNICAKFSAAVNPTFGMFAEPCII